MQQSVSQIPKASAGRRGRALRSGFLLAELVIALILLGIVASVLPVVLNAVYQQRQQERFERTAQLELANVATRIRQASGPTAATEPPELSAWFLRLYPDAELQVQFGATTADDPATLPVTMTISQAWGEEHPALKQSLTTWRFQREVLP